MRSWGIIIALAATLWGCDGDGADDAGPGDAGPGDAGVVDAGVDASAPMCTENIIDPFTGPTPCSMETAGCAAACTNFSCAQACVEADANTQCVACFERNQQACWNRNGCQEEWNCISQCLLENCPGNITIECLTVTCGAQDQAYADCFEPLRMMCGMRGADCFPM